MNKEYKTQIVAGWGLMDYNGHMANRAFLDMASDCRMMFFKENGLSMQAFMKLGVGPVVRRDELEYYREIRLMETVLVKLFIAGLSDDASKMRLRNEFYKEDGQLAATVTSFGGWLDLRERKLVVPPQQIRDLLAGLKHSDDYEKLA